MIKNNDLESTFENIKSYFETYVKTYQPYKDNPIFKSILETLIDTYYKELYIDVPQQLLDLVVKNVINPKTNIDYILIEIGIPEQLIKKLSVTEKWIFFQIFADFMRYKSTIQFFQMLGNVAETSFPEKINIYELWVDRDTETGNWILRPKPVYENAILPREINKTLLYSEVYDELPNLLISEQQLQTWYENNQLILPFKSNLILLDQCNITNVSEINGFLRTSFLKRFGNFKINLYFADSTFSVNLQFIDHLWYYLLFQYYDFEQAEKDFGKILLFSTQNVAVPDITQIQSIIQRYASINSWDDYQSFYRTYLEPFETNYRQQNVTVTTLHDNLLSIESDLINYIDNRINNADDSKSEISIILDEIYGSLLLSAVNYIDDEYYQQYLPVYINLLSKVIVDVSSDNIKDLKTFTTKIIFTLKPFHADVILETFKAVKSQEITFIDDSQVSITIDIIRKYFDLYKVGYFCGQEYSDYKFIGKEWKNIPFVGEIYVKYFTVVSADDGRYNCDALLPSHLWKVSGVSYITKVGQFNIGNFEVNKVIHDTNDDTLIIGSCIPISSDQDNEECPLLKPIFIEETTNIAEDYVDLQTYGFYIGDFIVDDGEVITLKEPNYKIFDIYPDEYLQERADFDDKQNYEVTDTGLSSEQIAGYYAIIGEITVENFRVVDHTFPLPATIKLNFPVTNDFSEDCRLVGQKVGYFNIDTVEVGNFTINDFNIADSDLFVVSPSQIVGASKTLAGFADDYFSTEVDEADDLTAFEQVDKVESKYSIDQVLGDFVVGKFNVCGISYIIKVGNVDVGNFSINEVVHNTSADTFIIGDSEQNEQISLVLKPVFIDESVAVAEDEVDLQTYGFYIGNFIINNGESVCLKKPNYRTLDIQANECLRESPDIEESYRCDIVDTGLTDEQIAGCYGTVSEIVVGNFRVTIRPIFLSAVADTNLHIENNFSENCQLVGQKVGYFNIDTIQIGNFIVNNFNVASSDLLVVSPSQIIGTSKNLSGFINNYFSENIDADEFTSFEEINDFTSDYLTKYIVGSLVLIGQFNIGGNYLVGSNFVVDTPPEQADGNDTFTIGNFIIGSYANKPLDTNIDLGFEERLNVSNVNVGNQFIVAGIVKIGDVTVGVFVIAQPDSDNYFTVEQSKENLVGSGLAFIIWEYKYSQINSSGLKVGIDNLYVTNEGFVQII